MNGIQVLAFMRPQQCIVSGETIFYSLSGALIQKGDANGIKIEDGEVTVLDRPLDQKKIRDAVNCIENGRGLHEHPFCLKHSQWGMGIYLDDPTKEAESITDVWLRMFLMSANIVPPNFWNLDGIFGILPNIGWLNNRMVVKAEFINHVLYDVQPYAVDKFPRLTDWWIPKGVRIADTSRIRLGAHLAPGTTVMHEGFCNFNAGTLGSSMVEGRISAGVVVGDGSDIGGGASIMGTLSGGGKEKISIGQSCLLGANAGLGISLGDNCIVEAGLYLTAGTKVKTPDGEVVAARKLSGESNILFRRHSQTGEVEAVPVAGTSWGGLNQDLHKN